VLSIVWLLAPDLLFVMWRVEHTASAALVGRRGAALFLALSTILHAVRHEPPSPCRRAISVGVSVGCLVLALLGAYELAARRAGAWILSAAALEIAVAFGFMAAERRTASDAT